MHGQQETRKALAALEPGAFERLAADVLRRADPRFTALLETGVNVDGRAVASPVDGIATQHVVGGRTLLLFQHTTTGSKGLRDKWLGVRGDVPKSLAIVGAEAARGATGEALLILATSSEPTEKLIRDVHARAGAAVQVHIWTGSRISDFLDNDPEGQWLRRRHLGTLETRLSASLLAEIGRESFDQHLPLVPRPEIVDRAVDADLERFVSRTRGAAFLVGESGRGKSVACRKLADRWGDRGGVALVLPHDIVETSATLAQAVAGTLQRHAPLLHPACGHDALALSTGDRPALFIVEDANLSASPGQLLDRLLGWTAGSGRGGGEGPGWLLLCPVWRSNIGMEDTARRQRIEARALHVGAYSRPEAVAAIAAGAAMQDARLTSLDVEELAEALDDDPLLIGLNRNWAEPTSSGAIQSYVAQGIADAAAGDLPADLRLALGTLMQECVRRRDPSPGWKTIRGWFLTAPDLLNALKRLLSHGAVIRLGPSHGSERLIYRHDRLRDHLHAYAIRALIEAGELDDDLWEDPFYAAQLGAALIDLPEVAIRRTADLNPPALFAALALRRLAPAKEEILVQAAQAWIASPAFRDAANEMQLHHAMRHLARVDAPFVRGMAEAFPASFPELEALLRNGSATAGASYCRTFDLVTNYPWRDRLVAHAVERHPQMVAELGALITDGQTTAKGLEGALNLAGEIGDSALAEPVAVRWRTTEGARSLDSSWLWAALRCCTAPRHPVLEEIAAAWASLPEKSERNGRDENPRWELAGHELPWALARRPDPHAIAWLIDLAKMQPGLESVIGHTLAHVDSVDAIVHTIHSHARAAERAGSDGNSYRLALAYERHWRPDRHGRTMSAAGRDAAAAIWRDEHQGPHHRRAAFLLWSQTPTREEVSGLAALEADPVLADDALKTRLAAGDQSATPLLRERLRFAEWPLQWWYHARGVGLDGLRAEIAELMQRRQTNPDEVANEDHVVAQMLMDRRDEYARAVIRDNWHHLRSCDDYLHAALFLADAELAGLAHAELRSSGDAAQRLKYLGHHWGIKTYDRPGVTDFAQLRTVTPWIPAIGEMDRMSLFEVANSLGETQWRKQNVDALLPTGRGCCAGTETALFASLDEEAGRSRAHGPDLHHWFERRQEEHWSRGQLLPVVARWAADRDTALGWLTLVSAIEEFGERADLRHLDELLSEVDADLLAAAANARYAVRWRSLT